MEIAGDDHNHKGKEDKRRDGHHGFGCWFGFEIGWPPLLPAGHGGQWGLLTLEIVQWTAASQRDDGILVGGLRRG